jgi:hypothetical protein
MIHMAAWNLMWIVWVRIFRCVPVRMFVSCSCWCQYKFLLSIKWFHKTCFLVRSFGSPLCLLNLTVCKIRSIFVVPWLFQVRYMLLKNGSGWKCIPVTSTCFCVLPVFLRSFSIENALYLVKSSNWDKNCRALVRVYHPHFLIQGSCNHWPSTCYTSWFSSHETQKPSLKTWPVIISLALHGQIIMTVYITT